MVTDTVGLKSDSNPQASVNRSSEVKIMFKIQSEKEFFAWVLTYSGFCIASFGRNSNGTAPAIMLTQNHYKTKVSMSLI